MNSDTNISENLKNEIDSSILNFFEFLKKNNCEKLAINKDGLSELTHKLELWNELGDKSKMNTTSNEALNEERNALETIKEKLFILNDYRF